MKTKLYLANILLAALLLAACSASSREFRSEAGKFSVKAPVLLVEKPQTIDPTYGKVDSHTFMAESDNITYVVAYSDFSQGVINQSDPPQMLNAARDSMISSVAGKLTLETVVSLGDITGRELVIDYTDSDSVNRVVKVRLYLVASRLYQVMVFAKKGVEIDPAITRFLDSFKLLAGP